MADALAVTRETVAEIFERLYKTRHNGPVTFHFAQGCPNVAELPNKPTRILLTRHPKQPQT